MNESHLSSIITMLIIFFILLGGQSGNVKAVLVKFDNPDVGLEQSEKYNYLSPKISKNCVPIFRSTLEYNLKNQKNHSKAHAATSTVTQIPLKLSWASTCHKLQGVTLRNIDFVCHSHEKGLPKAMAYVMLSRVSNIENVFLSDDFTLDMIRCDPNALKMKQELDKKSIVPEMKSRKFDLFYVNAMDLNKHIKDIQTDIYANQSDLICLVETWLEQPINWEEKKIYHASYGNGKGVCIYAPSNSEDYEFKGMGCTEKYQFISLLVKSKSIQLFLLYLSKGCPMDELAGKIKDLIDPQYQLLIFGDLNFDKSVVNQLTKMFNQNNLNQIIDIPTHDSLYPKTIDHVYCSEDLKNQIRVEPIFKYFSDHVSLNITFQ